MHSYERQDIDVFISHHTASSLQVTKAVAHALESRRIRCWYAPRDTVSQYAGEIVRAINTARIFLLILNSDASASFDVLNEFNVAAQRLRNREELTILSFRIDQKAELSDDMQYYGGRFHWINAVDPPLQARIDELVDKVASILGVAAVDAPANASPAAPACELVSNMPLPREDFTGRQAELEQIHTLLNASNKLFLHGMGGIGKTELAKEYARRYAQEYTNRIIVSFNGSVAATIASDSQLRITGMERGSADLDVYFQRKMELLEKHLTPQTLIVFDNFDVMADPDLERLLQLNCTILFTTRTDFSLEGLPVLPLHAIDDPLLLREIFLNNCPACRSALTEETTRQIDALIALMNGHTMAITILARQMVSSRKSPAEMLALLRSRGLHDLGLRERIRHSFSKPARTGFDLLQELYSLESLTAEELHIMKELVFLPVSGLDARSIHDWCGLDSYEVLDALAQRSWIQHQAENDAFSLHPLVAEVVFANAHSTFPTDSTLLKNALNSKYTDDAASNEKKAGIALRMISLYPQITCENEAVYFNAAKTLSNHCGHQQLLQNILLRVFEIRQQIYPPTHNKLVEIVMSLLEHLPIADPQWPAIEAFANRLVEMLMTEKRHMLTVQLLISLGKKYAIPDWMDNTIRYAELAKVEYAQIGDDRSTNLKEISVLYMYDPKLLEATLCHFLISKVHMYKGEHEQAFASEQRAWEICRDRQDDTVEKLDVWKELNYQSFTSMQGVIRIEMGMWEDAKKLLTESERILNQYRHPEHIAFKRIYEGLLRIALHDNDEGAILKYRRLLTAMLEANYTAEHPFRRNLTERYSL